MFHRNEVGDHLKPPTRVHYPWHEMEEYHPDGGMWAIPPATERQRFIDASADLMRAPAEFETAMLEAIAAWPRSCNVALSSPGLNKRAWLGHAGCFIATGSPEETTRLGWHQLTDSEQRAANAAADRAIDQWRRAHRPTLIEDLFTALKEDLRAQDTPWR